MLDAAPTLQAIATLLAARSGGGLDVYVNQDGRSRDLNTSERCALDEFVQAARTTYAPSELPG
jgi:hypothetical protein